MLDLPNPCSPQEVGHYRTGGKACQVFCDSEYAYVGCGNGGIYVVDVREPESIHCAGYYPSTWWTYSVYYGNPYIYATNEEAGIMVLEFTGVHER